MLMCFDQTSSTTAVTAAGMQKNWYAFFLINSVTDGSHCAQYGATSRSMPACQDDGHI